MANTPEHDSAGVDPARRANETPPKTAVDWDEVIEESFPASDPPPEPTILTDRVPVRPPPQRDHSES